MSRRQFVYRMIFLWGIIGTLVLLLFVGTTVYDAYQVNFPSKGYGTTINVSFGFPDVPLSSYNPYSISAYVTLNTSSAIGLGFAPDVPISVSISAYTSNFTIFVQNPTIYVTFQDAGQVTKSGALIETLPFYQGVAANRANQSSTWTGTGKIWFPLEGNYPAQMTLVSGNHSEQLQQLSNFVIPIEPLSVVQTNYSNQANITLTVAILFLGIMEAGFLFSEIWRKGKPTESERHYPDEY